jgi:hypothetical protein
VRRDALAGPNPAPHQGRREAPRLIAQRRIVQFSTGIGPQEHALRMLPLGVIDPVGGESQMMHSSGSLFAGKRQQAQPHTFERSKSAIEGGELKIERLR